MLEGFVVVVGGRTLPQEPGCRGQILPQDELALPPPCPGWSWGFPGLSPHPALGTSPAGGKFESPHGAEPPPDGAGGVLVASPQPGCGCG